MNGWSGWQSPLKQEIEGTIKKKRKKHARSIRPKTGEYIEGQPEGSQSTHLMGSDIIDNPTGVYHVWPTVTNKTESGEYEDQDRDQALKAGEMYEFKSKRRAEKFAAGSWKKGKDRREAMRAYRKKKRAIKRNFSSVRPLYFDMD